MRRLLAIATLTVRQAVRSRVLLILAALLALAVVSLPLTIRGDGTVGGQVQVMLRYSLGFAFVLLAVALVWSGCAAIATEVRDRQMHLVATKPVYALEIWLGKWLGLLALLAVLLGGSGAVVFGLLHVRFRAADLDDGERQRLREEILVARAEIRPVMPEVDRPARAELERRRAAGELPPEVPVDEVYRALRRSLLVQAFSVPAGGRASWRFRVSPRPDPGRPFVLQFRFEKSVMDLEPVQGRWVFERPGDTRRREVAGTYRPRAIHTVPVPLEAIGPDGILRVHYENVDPTPALLLFDPDDGLMLLPYRGTFAANYVRALLVLYARLAFLAALGLATGTLFSLPVAAFASVSTAFLLLLGDYIERMAGQGAFFGTEPAAGWVALVLDRLFALVFQALAFVVRPLRGADPLDLLATGRWVGWGFVGQEFLVQMVIYGGVMALGCAAIFRRRELGLPT